MPHHGWLTLLLFVFLFVSCDLDQEIDIELPAYENQPVLECYLQPGQPFSLLLTRSAGFFDPFPTANDEFLENILLDGARVQIRFDDEVVELENRPYFNPFTRRLSNYYSNAEVPNLRGDAFQLEVVLPTGETITAATHLLPVVPIDSVVVQYDDEQLNARVLTYFRDIPGETNYYRRMFHKTSLDSLPEQDFTSDDRFVDSIFVFGTGYNYESGDAVISTLLHIDQAYFDFLESLNNAVSSSGNPFGQPSAIISNLEGTANAVGIFTGLSFSRVALIVPPPG